MADVKSILCFGDSNTWGYDPVTGARHLYADRWPSVMQSELGADYVVIPEGLNGRTISSDDPIDDRRNGRTALRMILDTHKPLDLVIIMLGTNDCKHRFALLPEEMAEGIRGLIEVVRVAGCGPEPVQVEAPGDASADHAPGVALNDPGAPASAAPTAPATLPSPPGDPGQLARLTPPPAVLVVAPPHILGETAFGAQFTGARETSMQLAAEYAQVCAEEGVHFLDGAAAAVCSPADGIHLDTANQRALGDAVAAQVRRILA